MRDRENFNKLVSRGNGKLADNAKREEYERQIQLKKVKSTKPDDHAIAHMMDLKENETEENYVRRLATGLCTVWNNNPTAFKWWRELV